MTVSFSSIALSIPSPSNDWQVFNLGQWLRDIGLSWFNYDITIRTYALWILLGISAAVALTAVRLKRRGAEPWVVVDIVLWAVPFGIVGARIFHVLTHSNDYFGVGKDPLKMLYIWDGGMAIFGALLLGAVGAFVGCRLAGLRFWSFADTVAPGLLIAQAFGRLGNYFNHEYFGLPTDLPWGLQIESTNPAFPPGLSSSTLFQPVFLYEIIWDLLGVAVILLLERTFTLHWGKVFALYLIWYGIGRSYLESIRIDPNEVLLGIRINIWAAWAMALVGAIIFLLQRRRHLGGEPGPYLPGHEWTGASSALNSEDTYSDSDDPGDGAGERLTAMSTG